MHWQSNSSKTLSSRLSKGKQQFLGKSDEKVRNKFGNEALEANEVIMNIFRNKNDGDSAYMFVADQTPMLLMLITVLNF
jgi:KDO2-lipid IV(A) lauroyltransferase